MCGIAGMFESETRGARPHSANELVLRRMLKAIYHRGPDGSGIHQEPGIGIGSVRLSIIDLAAGNQPMSNADGSIWIVFNGEIFNYIELRDDLRAKGHIFRTQSDTEVLIHLYEEKGIEGVSCLNGDFSFALWDERQQTLFLARDRVGIRPLFYTMAKGTLVFASEIKAILEHPDVTAQLSGLALSQIFTFWTTLSPRTAFEGVFELPPGQYMKASKQGITFHAYWQLCFSAIDERSERPFADVLEEFRWLFNDAIRLRLRSDVPVAAYLSGGLDSCTTTAFMKTAFMEKAAANHLSTFSIGFADQEFDETTYQKLAAQHFATAHTSLCCDSAAIASVFPEVIRHAETPILRTAPAPMYLLSKLVRENGIKVVMTGEGADEMLAGYNIFKEMAIRRFWGRQPDSEIRPQLLRRLYPYLPQLQQAPSGVLRLFFGHRLNESASPLYSHLLRWHNTARIKRYFTADFCQQTADYDPYLDVQSQLPERFAGWQPLAQAQYLETTIFMSNYLLSAQGDRMTMANSVEGRYPFLDYRIIEFCARLPSTFKLRGLSEKYLLKQMMQGQLPDAIRQRPKQAYRAPIAACFLAKDAPDYVRALLSEQKLAQTGIFDARAVTQFLKQAEAGAPISETDGMALVGILSTQLLHQLFIQ